MRHTLTIQQTAAWLGITQPITTADGRRFTPRAAVLRLSRAGWWRVHRIRNKLLIPRADLRVWLAWRRDGMAASAPAPFAKEGA